MNASNVLLAHVEDYFERLSRLSYGDLQRRQAGFHASLAFGAAGVAYACWHTALVLDEPELLDEAARWLGGIREETRLSFRVPLSEIPERPASQFLYGEAGLVFVRALVAHARRDEPARNAAFTRFAELSRASRESPPELYNGTAGCLAGAAILTSYTGDPRLREVASELGKDLVRRAADDDGTMLWPELRGFGLSHGSAGPYLALLLQSIATGNSLPGWYSAALERLLDRALQDPSLLCPNDSYHSLLCNGFAGLALLGARAHRQLGGEALLAAARQAGRLALVTASDNPDLCCGRAGPAYACLALAEVDPAGPWKQKATDLVLSILLSEPEEWTKAGLYGGEAVVPCLAASLVADTAFGLPGFDLIGWPEPPRA
jgi:hypothetical protein